tara:strand:+ start:141 stop:365 length:225 start_codon:yes stop_codon:yes gene_type:complete
MKTLVKNHLEEICKKRVDTIVGKLKENNYSRYEEREYTKDFLMLLSSCYILFYGPKKTDGLFKKMEQAMSKKYN